MNDVIRRQLETQCRPVPERCDDRPYILDALQPLEGSAESWIVRNEGNCEGLFKLQAVNKTNRLSGLSAEIFHRRCKDAYSKFL